MTFKSIPLLLLLATLMVLLVRCGGTTSPAPLPTKDGRLTVIPTQTQTLPTVTASSTATSPTATPVPVAAIPTPNSIVQVKPVPSEVRGVQFTMSGTILSDEGMPVTDAIVFARTEDDQTLVEGRSMTDGSFRLQLEVDGLPVRLLVEVFYFHEVGIPTVTTTQEITWTNTTVYQYIKFQKTSGTLNSSGSWFLGAL